MNSDEKQRRRQSRLRGLSASLGAALAAWMITPALAQTWPAKPVKIVVNYTPGGPTDLTARTMGGKMQDITGQPFVIENTPSANGAIGTQAVSRATADGYTLLFSTAGHTAVAKALSEDKLPFDPFRDITPISMLVTNNQLIMVYPGLGVKSIDELVKLARSKPGHISYGSPGVGTSNHLGLELLKSMAGIDMLHVPYKGTAPMMQDLIAGRVQVVINGAATVLPQIKAGKVTALASGWTTRARALPDVPTMEELGYKGYEVSTWFALFAPPKTPAAVVARINFLSGQALNDAQVTKTLTAAGFDPLPSTPEFVTKMMREEYERWRKVVAEAKIVAE